jgi:cation transport regulator ChaC
VPSLETLEKLARGLQVPLYQILYDGDAPPKLEKSVQRKDDEWGHSGRHAYYLSKLRKALAAMSIDDRKLLLYMVQRMAARR